MFPLASKILVKVWGTSRHPGRWFSLSGDLGWLEILSEGDSGEIWTQLSCCVNIGETFGRDPDWSGVAYGYLD